MNASVVIPTRDRPLALRRCLASVREQRRPLDVVVVDDGSAVPEAVATVAREFGARIVRLDGVGPAAARNAGAAESRGSEVVLLLDDDCVVGAGWAEELVQAAVSGARVVAAGVVFPPRGANVWLRASERIAIEAEKASRFFRTMNLSCRRELLLELPFDECFRTAGGEDRDWCVRAERAGVVFARVPGATVDHCSSLGARTFVGQQVRYGRAAHLLRRRGTHERMSLGAFRRGIVAGVRDSPGVGVAMVAGHAAAAVGYLLESRSPAVAVG